MNEQTRPRADAPWLTATVGVVAGLAWRDQAALGLPAVPGALGIAAAVVLGARGAPRAARGGWWSGAGALVLAFPALACDALTTLTTPADAARTWPWISAAAAGFGAAPAARAARGGVGTALAIIAGLVVGTEAPREIATAAVLGGVLLAARGASPGDSMVRTDPHAPAARIAGALLFLAGTAIAFVLAARGAPVARALPAAAALAVLLASGRPGRTLHAVSAGVLGGALAAAWAGAVATPSRLAPWGLALAAGALAGSGGRLLGGVWTPAALMMLAALAGTTVLRALPAEIQARLAEVRPRDDADAARLADARRDTRLVLADAGGAGIVVRADPADRPLYELGGALLDPRTRLARAEGWTATLAACAAPRRGHARVTGDTTARATATLRTYGFATLDVSVPSADLARAVRAFQPTVERTLLGAGVRLLRAPDAWVARVGTRADAVVEIVRAPGSTGPDDDALRRTRRSLATGGVHARLVPLVHTAPEEAVDALHAFAAAYPDATAWLSPEGLDALVLLGTHDGAPPPWSALQRCVEEDAESLRTLGIGNAIDLLGLLLSDRGGLAAATVPARTVDLVHSLGARPLDLAGVVAPDAPRADLAARRDTRRAWIDLLGRAEDGAPPVEVFTRGAALRARPGGAAALAPLVRPHLQRARDALSRARREGPASPAWSEVDGALATARMVTPDAADVACLEGELAEARTQPDRAREAYTRCVSADPTRVAGWEGLARVERARGDAKAVEAALRGALAAGAGRWASHHNLGVFLMDSGRTDAAEPLLSQAAALAGRVNPVPPEPLLALARLHLATDRPALALAEAERAVALAPEHAHAHALRGAARYELGQLDLAEEEFRAALARDPRDLLARGGLGQVHASRGEADLAAAAFREVLARDPRNPAARENLRRLGPMLRDATPPAQGGRTP